MPGSRRGRTPRTSPPGSRPSSPGAPRSHRAYLLKEGPRLVFALPLEEAAEALEYWIGWARRCRILAVVDLPRRIANTVPQFSPRSARPLERTYRVGNTKIRLITRIAFGFRSPDALIALAMLSLGGHKPFSGRI